MDIGPSQFWHSPNGWAGFGLDKEREKKKDLLGRDQPNPSWVEPELVS